MDHLNGGHHPKRRVPKDVTMGHPMSDVVKISFNLNRAHPGDKDGVFQAGDSRI